VSDPAGEPVGEATPAPERALDEAAPVLDDAAPGPVTVSGLDESAMAASRERWATRAKPPGSLGAL
jgi:hypothetical protein